GIDAFLQGNFVRCSLEDKSPGPGIKAFVIFANHYEIDVLRFLVLQGAETLVIEFNRAEVDVLLQLEPGAQEDAFLQDTRLDVRVPDGAEQNGGELAQLLQDTIRQNFTRLQIAFATDIIV